jgi:hypothetical protein
MRKRKEEERKEVRKEESGRATISCTMTELESWTNKMMK